MTRLLIEPGAAPHTFDAASETYEYHRCTLKKHGRTIGGKGIRGTLSHPKERLRQGSYFVYGELEMDIAPADFQTLLPHMGFPNVTLGAPNPPDTFKVDDCPPYFGVLIDKGADVFQYKNCKMNRWSLEGRAPRFREEEEPDMMRLVMEIYASDELEGQTWPSPWPALGVAGDDAPYVFYDSDPTKADPGSMSFYAEEREVLSFRLWQDLNLQMRYSNSLAVQCISARDRIIGCDLILPWNNDEKDIYGTLPENAVSATVKFTHGNYSTEFQIGAFDAPDNGAEIIGKEELYLVLRGFCYSVSLNIAASPETGTRELVVLNDTMA